MTAPGSDAAPRVFFALWPSPAQQQRLAAAARAQQAICGGRVSRPETLHLTLLFLGPVDAARMGALQAAAAKVQLQPFTLQLRQLACWPRQRIAYAAPGGPCEPLSLLVEDLRQQVAAAGFAFDDRGFKPHVTLLRKIEHAVPPVVLPRVILRVRGFDLMASVPTAQGHAYRRLASWHAV